MLRTFKFAILIVACCFCIKILLQVGKHKLLKISCYPFLYVVYNCLFKRTWSLLAVVAITIVGEIKVFFVFGLIIV
jgi:hypothetical protein